MAIVGQFGTVVSSEKGREMLGIFRWVLGIFGVVLMDFVMVEEMILIKKMVADLEMVLIENGD